MTTVCVGANTAHYPQGGGHMWAYLNWALGLRANGCRIIWLEAMDPAKPEAELLERATALEKKLEIFGLVDCVAFYSTASAPLPPSIADRLLDLECASRADLLLNLNYSMPQDVVDQFRQSVLVDIDPGLLQLWM